MASLGACCCGHLAWYSFCRVTSQKFHWNYRRCLAVLSETLQRTCFSKSESTTLSRAPSIWISSISRMRFWDFAPSTSFVWHVSPPKISTENHPLCSWDVAIQDRNSAATRSPSPLERLGHDSENMAIHGYPRLECYRVTQPFSLIFPIKLKIVADASIQDLMFFFAKSHCT